MRRETVVDIDVEEKLGWLKAADSRGRQLPIVLVHNMYVIATVQESFPVTVMIFAHFCDERSTPSYLYRSFRHVARHTIFLFPCHCPFLEIRYYHCTQYPKYKVEGASRQPTQMASILGKKPYAIYLADGLTAIYPHGFTTKTLLEALRG